MHRKTKYSLLANNFTYVISRGESTSSPVYTSNTTAGGWNGGRAANLNGMTGVDGSWRGLTGDDSMSGGGWLIWVFATEDIWKVGEKFGRSAIEGDCTRPDGSDLKGQQIEVNEITDFRELQLFIKWWTADYSSQDEKIFAAIDKITIADIDHLSDLWFKTEILSGLNGADVEYFIRQQVMFYTETLPCISQNDWCCEILLQMKRDAIQDCERRLSLLREIVSYFNTSDVVLDNLGPLLASGENREALQSIEDQVVGEFTYWAGAAFAPPSLKKITGECHEKCSPQEFWPILRNSIEKTSVLLDLGTGIRPNFFIGQETTICVELFDGYLKHLKDSMTNTNVVVVKDDALAFLERQPSRSIDTIVVTDFIEHLSREFGLKLIKELKRVVSVQALVVTPKGFLLQHVGEGEDDGWGFFGNELQNHLSGWDVDDFQGWAILEAPEYYLDIGYSAGVIGAIFTKTPKQGQELVFVVEPIKFGSDDELALNLLFEALIQVELLGTKFPYRFIMPIPKSPKSKLIDPRKRLPVGEIEFASFNLEVNNALAAGVFPNFVTFPGTVHYYLHQVKADCVVIVQGQEPTGIHYSKFVTSENIQVLNLDYRKASNILEHLKDLNECSLHANNFLELWDVQKRASS